MMSSIEYPIVPFTSVIVWFLLFSITSGKVLSNRVQRTFMKLSPVETAFRFGRNVDPRGKEFFAFSGANL